MNIIKTLLSAGLVISVLASCTISRPTVTQLVPDPPVFMVAYPMKYTVNKTNHEIIVPFGFITDLASIPKGLWWWESPQEATMAPAILHDYLYWQQVCTKDESDAVMYLAMQDVNMGAISQRAVYAGIRTPFAQFAWNANRNAKAGGELRFFTDDYARSLLDSEIEPGATMAAIQAQAVQRGGMYSPPTNSIELKLACEAAMRLFNDQ